MKSIIASIKITLLLALLLMGIYPTLVLGIAWITPNHGKGEMIKSNQQTYYRNIGQSFTQDSFFNGRPSAVNYHADGSGGSNKCPENTEYLQMMQARIDTFLLHNPGIDKSQIPADLLTASGSGLDPNISVQAARVQVKRIAIIRRIKEEDLYNLIDQLTEKRTLNFFGEEKLNVLELNIALTSLAHQ